MSKKESDQPKDIKKSTKAQRETKQSLRTRQKAKQKSEKAKLKAAKLKAKQKRREQPEKEIKSYFIIWRPFVRLGRYLRDSWRELAQVRWPSRKAAWKMTAAVLVYVAIFMIFIMLLDALFSWIFSLLLGN